jgi:hypothetical protein
VDGLRISTLSLILLWIFFASLLQLRPIDDCDIFTQIQLGNIVLNSHSLFLNDSFSYLIYGKEIPNPGWLAQLIFAFLHDHGSWRAIKLTNGILFSGAFFITGFTALIGSSDKNNFNLFCLLLAVSMGFLVAANSSSARPQVFAVFCFALLFFIIRSGLRKEFKLFFALPVCLFWQNTHPSLSLAIVLVGTEILSNLYARINGINNRNIMILVVLLIFILPIQTLTPESTNIFNLNMTNFIVSRKYLGISEWMPPWHQSVFEAMICFWLLLVFTIFGLVRVGFRGVNIQDLFLSSVFCILALCASRFCLFWAIVSIPLWNKLINSLKPANLFNWSFNSNISAYRASCLLSLSIIVFSVLATISPTLSDRLPLKGIEVLKSVENIHRVYNYREWGGPLIYAGYAQWTVMIDGRLYLYDLQHWNNYIREASGEMQLDDIIEKHNPSAFFLHPTFHVALILLLENSSDWEKVYSDSSSIIYLPI